MSRVSNLNRGSNSLNSASAFTRLSIWFFLSGGPRGYYEVMRWGPTKKCFYVSIGFMFYGWIKYQLTNNKNKNYFFTKWKFTKVPFKPFAWVTNLKISLFFYLYNDYLQLWGIFKKCLKESCRKDKEGHCQNLTIYRSKKLMFVLKFTGDSYESGMFNAVNNNPWIFKQIWPWS